MGEIVRYRPEMDERLADLLNIGWAGLRGFPQLYVRADKWPVVDAEVLAKWREQGRLSEAGTFVAEHDEDNLGGVFSASAGDEQTGTLHFWCVNAHYRGNRYAPRLMAAMEDYLRECGMTAVVTEPMDSRCPARNRFMQLKGYSVSEPERETVMMVLQPEGRRLREVVLPDESYQLLTWRDDLLDDWVRVADSIFEWEVNESSFVDAFASRDDFDPEGWFILQHEGKAAGIAGAMACYEQDGTLRGGSIEWVAVLEEYRGKHLGRALMTAALNYFVERDITPVTLNTQLYREAAVALYRDLGFEIGAHLHRYRKQLDADS